MTNNIEIIQLNSYVKPEILLKYGADWVLNGENNSYYQYIIDRYNGSPTNSSILDSYSRFAYGLGLNINLPLFDKKEVRKIVKDFMMFSEATFELIYRGGKPIKAVHIPKEKVAPNKADKKGNISAYWYCYNWEKQNEYPPKKYDAYGFGKGANRSEIVCIRDYQVGQFYFSNPAYLSIMPYAELEEEIGNFFINHVKNKFMVSTIINLNNGIPETEEERKKIAREYKGGTTGTTNAGVVVVAFNDNKDNATTIEQVQVNDAYQQYSFLAEEAQNKICVGHRVVSKTIIGLDKSVGLSSNAQEIETAFTETMLNVIKPQQEIILDTFQDIAKLIGVTQEIDFIPLRNKTQASPVIMSSVEIKPIAEPLIELGENINLEEWELIDEQCIDGEPTLTETTLKLASVPSSFPNVSSEQDTSLFKIRYQYSGDGTGEREFCSKMIKANKVYRKEDIELASTKVVNAGLGLDGTDTYNIWLYKGGVNCKHFWMRKIYLRKGNNSISVNQAKKMILDLEPKDRKNAKWQENDKLVAQPAQESNNFFKAKENGNIIKR